MGYTKLIIDTPKGQFELPLSVVAEHRTEYFSKHDNFEKDSNEWNEEIDFVMNDIYEGIDWLLNNMDWDDVKDKATKINDTVNVTDEDFWTSSDNIDIK